MPVTDLKVSFRKKNNDFENDGFRILPVTLAEYVVGLLGADGKIDPSLIPAWLFNGRTPVGIVDLSNPGIDIESIVNDPTLYNGTTDVSAQGGYVEVTSEGDLINQTNPTDHEIVGAGDEGDNEFPIHLEVGDYIVLAKINETAPTYSWAIVNRSYRIADTASYGITKLYAGVDSPSNVLAATPGAVKSAYDLANSKETAFSKNSAFNKNFGGNGVAETVARSDHYHSTFDRASSVLSGAVVFSNIVIDDGIVTSIATRSLTLANLGYTGDTDANNYTHPTFTQADIDTNGAQIIDTIDLNNGHVNAITLRSLVPTDIGTGAIDDGVEASDVVWSGSYIAGEIDTLETSISQVQTLAKKGLEYYVSLSAADAGGHETGDICAVLEA